MNIDCAGEHCNDRNLHDLWSLPLRDGFQPRPGEVIIIFQKSMAYVEQSKATTKCSCYFFLNVTNIEGRGEEQSEKYRDEAWNCQDRGRRLSGLVSGQVRHLHV